MKANLLSFLSVLITASNSQFAKAFTPSNINSIRISNNNNNNQQQFTTKSALSVAQDMFVDKTETHSSVTNYYGETLKQSDDLLTNACCTAGAPAPHIASAISNIHPEVIKKYYGCGFCVPDEVEGMTILDLGCGAGRDVYIASQLVGEKGRVIGVDMTPEQLKVAKETQAYHAEKFGYDNVEFHLGLIEKLDDIPSLADGSVDVIISNCVINLCPDKESVLKSCHRLLKPGGELYFSDVYASRRVPEELQKDEVLWGECLSGALYWNDFQNLGKKCGFKDPRLVEDSPITIENKAVQDKMDQMGHSNLEFFSATYRLFQLDCLEPHCEDYGQAVIYKGTIPRFESGWALDDHHYMEKGKIFPVCGNTYNMLKETRFEKHFDFVGDWSTHYGIFEGCGTSIPYKSAAVNGGVSTKFRTIPFTNLHQSFTKIIKMICRNLSSFLLLAMVAGPALAFTPMSTVSVPRSPLFQPMRHTDLLHASTAANSGSESNPVQDKVVMKLEKKEAALDKKRAQAMEQLNKLEESLTEIQSKKKEYLNGLALAESPPGGNFSETTGRSAVKALMWRVIAGSVTFITSLRFSGSVATALSIVGSDFFSKALTMFIGERLMNKSQAGRDKGADGAGRSLAKALIWRLFAICNTLTMAIFIAKDISIASKIAGSDAIFKTGLMFFYERVWAKIEWGKEYEVEFSI